MGFINAVALVVYVGYVRKYLFLQNVQNGRLKIYKPPRLLEIMVDIRKPPRLLALAMSANIREYPDIQKKA